MNVENMSVSDFVWIAAMGLGFVGLSGGAWWAMSRQDVWLCNGLPGAVHVQIDRAAPVAIPPGERKSVNLRVGVRTVQVITPDGKLLSHDHVVVPSRHDLVAYNVLGAMPLYAAAVVYKSAYGDAQNPPPPEFYAGQRLIARDHVDYLFTQPPERISINSKDNSDHTKWFVDVMKGGWQNSVWRAQALGNERDTLELCQAVAGLLPKDEEAQECVVNQTASAHGYEAARKAAERALQQLPRSLSLHRSYQGVMRQLDRTAELRAQYASLHTQSPHDPLLTALYGRTLAPEAAIPILQKTMVGEGELPARRALALLQQSQGRLNESLEQLEQLAKTDPEYRRYVADHARVLLGLGRAREALAVALAVAGDKNKGDWLAAVLVAEVVRAGAIKDMDGMQYVHALGKEDEDAEAYMRSYLGEDPVLKAGHGTPHIQKAASIQAAAARDPAAAWSACQDLQPGLLRQLSPVVALLLATEFERAGDPATAAPLWRQVLSLGVPLPALRAYVQDGTTHHELWRLNADELTVLRLVRARAVEAEGGDASPLYKALDKQLVLNGVVARAITGWPHVATQGKVVTLRQVPSQVPK